MQHLDPVHESALRQILAKATAMPVREAADNLPVEPNRVYIIPPNRNMSIAQGRLKLAPRRQTAGAPRLRQQPGLERIALAALTEWGQEDDRLRARAAGFDHHFVKPIDVDVLRAWFVSLDPA